MEYVLGLSLLLLAGALVAAGRLWQWSIQTTERVKRLEEAAKKQVIRRDDHTPSTNAALEDALAIAMRVMIEQQMQTEYVSAYISKLQSILQTARAGPHAYPIDQPTGKGISKRRVTYTDSYERAGD